MIVRLGGWLCAPTIVGVCVTGQAAMMKVGLITFDQSHCIPQYIMKTPNLSDSFATKFVLYSNLTR